MQSERLLQDAARLRLQAEKLPDGMEREKLLRMAYSLNEVDRQRPGS